MALRAEFHSGLTHAKLDYPPFVADGDAGTLLKFDYRMGADKMGTFTVEVPADCAAAANAIAGRELWFYDGDYVVFKGVIRTREYAVDANNRKILTLVGPSITDQLNGTHTGRGLQFESSTLTAGITTLLTGTDFAAGTIDTATIPAREYNDRYIFDAVLATAQAVDCSVRENLLTDTPTLDVGVFGESTDITLRNLPESSPSLLDNDYMKQIGSIKVKAQSLDIRNRITPWGQIEGIGGLQFNLARVYPANPVLTTRLYLNDATAASIEPTGDSTWETAVPADEYFSVSTDRGSTAPSLSQVDNSATGDRHRLTFVYGPLGEQTLGGNVTGQFITSESGAGTNATLQMLIKVVSPDGLTVRGKALLHGTYGNEANTTARNLTFPSTALTPVDVTAGDFLIIELGFRKLGAGTAEFYIGNNGTVDLPVDETTTDTTMNPWIEFSQFISLGTELPSGATYEIQSQTRNGRLEYYIEDADSIAQYGVREASPIFKDIFPLGLTNLDFGLASTTLYGMAVQYLQKHTAEQVAYEVEVLGLRHVNPNNGAAFFRPGDTFRLQFDGWTQNADGSKTDYLTVDRDLYILDFTVTYDSAGVPMVKVTLSTFLRAERSDSEIIKQMAKEIGIANVSPLSVIRFGDYPSGNYGELRPDGLLIVSDQDEPFLETRNIDTNGSTAMSTLPQGWFSWLTELSNGDRIRVFDLDKTTTAGFGSSITGIFNDGTPVHAVFLLGVYRTDTGANICDILGSCAVGGTVTGSDATTTIGLNGSSGIDYSGHTQEIRYFGIAIVAYSD